MLQEEFNSTQGDEVIRTLSYDRFKKLYRLTQIDGRQTRAHCSGILAANDSLHGELVKLLQGGRKSVVEPRRTA